MEETWVSLLVLPLLVLEILVEAHVWCSTETEQPKNEGKHSSCLTELYVVIQHLWKNQGHYCCDPTPVEESRTLLL